VKLKFIFIQQKQTCVLLKKLFSVPNIQKQKSKVRLKLSLALCPSSVSWRYTVRFKMNLCAFYISALDEEEAHLWPDEAKTYTGSRMATGRFTLLYRSNWRERQQCPRPELDCRRFSLCSSIFIYS